MRIDMSKVDHFIEFINPLYFYQHVSFGSKLLKLDSGQTIEMPKVVRTVTRSIIINQYIQFCQEEKCEPLSRSSLFKILEVREASQRISLQGLDNTAPTTAEISLSVTSKIPISRKAAPTSTLKRATIVGISEMFLMK